MRAIGQRPGRVLWGPSRGRGGGCAVVDRGGELLFGSANRPAGPASPRRAAIALWTRELCKSFKEVFGLRDAKDFGCGVEAIKPRYTEGSDLTGFPALG